MPLSDRLNGPTRVRSVSVGTCIAPLKQFGLVLLCAAWILLGLFGHDPWKPDDATSFGIAYDMLAHGDWIVPQLAGDAGPGARAAVPAIAAAASAARTSVGRWHCTTRRA